ncbi:MAG: hypothetical protein DWB45_06365, partial [Xanthomonadales bacterium]|nr:hypothetical protein [Xanthomonadales bacterium]
MDTAMRGAQRSGAGTAAQDCVRDHTFISAISAVRVRHCRGAGRKPPTSDARKHKARHEAGLCGQACRRAGLRNPCHPCR